MLETKNNQQAGTWQWLEAGRSFIHPKKLGSFMDNVLLPLLALQKAKRMGATNCTGNKSSVGGEQQSE